MKHVRYKKMDATNKSITMYHLDWDTIGKNRYKTKPLKLNSLVIKIKLSSQNEFYYIDNISYFYLIRLIKSEM